MTEASNIGFSFCCNYAMHLGMMHSQTGMSLCISERERVRGERERENGERERACLSNPWKNTVIDLDLDAAVFMCSYE